MTRDHQVTNSSALSSLTDGQNVILSELVGRDLQVQWGRASSDSTGDIVVGTVTWAEPTTKVTSLTDRDTTQVGTDTQHDQPFRLLDTLVISLRVSQRRNIDLVGLLNLIAGSVSDENWLTLPLNNDVASLWDGSQLHLNLGHGQDIGRSRHGRKEGLDSGLGTGGRQQTHGTDHEVSKVLVVLLASVVKVAGEVRLGVWRKGRGGRG